MYFLIFTQIGTYTMAICAREMKKPFYVLTESFKFSRIYPLNQVDLPDEFKVNWETRCFSSKYNILDEKII